MSQSLFVHGTLAPVRPNEHVLAEVPGHWEDAQVRGTLVTHGRGVALGSPAVELHEHGDVVQSLLIPSEVLEEDRARLDDFEGDARNAS